MQPSLKNKLDQLLDRHDELSALMSDTDVIGDQDRFRKYSVEYAEIEPVVVCYRQFEQKQAELEQARSLEEDADEEIREMVAEEVEQLEADIEKLDAELHKLLLPKDPKDSHNVFLEIRAGTGGDEASLFAGDLLRMYLRFAEDKNWRVEVISEREGEQGGYKEVILRIEGRDVYSQLKFESGAHRVQRVPQTESQGRIHTSACTVAVIPEPDELDEIEVDKNDLRVDTFRASGAGGQHVNKTDSAIRLTHIPSGIVVECQEERSQHKNRARAMSLLQAKLNQQAEDERNEEQVQQRRNLVGSGDRSEKIRTYNFPDGRVTDHRINLTLHRLPQTMAGDLSPIIDQLVQEHQADLLHALGQESGDA